MITLYYDIAAKTLGTVQPDLTGKTMITQSLPALMPAALVLNQFQALSRPDPQGGEPPAVVLAVQFETE